MKKNNPMSEERTKLTREELEDIQGIQKEIQNITYDLGSLEVQKITIEQKKQQLTEAFVKVVDADKALAEVIFGKYGKGNIDFESGEFIKTE